MKNLSAPTQSASPTQRRLYARLERLNRAGYGGSAVFHFAEVVLGMHPPAEVCEGCQEALPDYIEAELNHRLCSEDRIMRHHLHLCPTCEIAYVELLETALAVDEGTLTRPLLPLDLSFLEPPVKRRDDNA